MIQKRSLFLMNGFISAKDIFRKDLADIPEEKRVRLLLWPLKTAEHKKLNSYIRPKKLSTTSHIARNASVDTLKLEADHPLPCRKAIYQIENQLEEGQKAELKS
ncbi:unnamed protein product [Hymenolepis diminuta]|uniref:Uncharacterized protein n=1 Tax=Hymenolepis diminuta TaxID=6216 RepID=A0A564YUK4_HYMDI|nr:unnamed protein product [Hymenolepis diminuta]